MIRCMRLHRERPANTEGAKSPITEALRPKGRSEPITYTRSVQVAAIGQTGMEDARACPFKELTVSPIRTFPKANRQGLNRRR